MFSEDTDRWERLVSPPGILAWRRAGSGDRSSFFVTWAGDVPPTTPLGDPTGRRTGSGRIRRSPRSETPAVDRLLAHGVGLLDGEDLDDSLLGVSRTALFDRSRKMSDPERFVDPDDVPFLTLSTRWTFRSAGVALGDFATALDPINGRYVHAIVGDSRDVPGVEPSPCLLSAMGRKALDPMIYLIHPGSGKGQGSIPSLEEIDRRGQALYHGRDGTEPPWSETLGRLVIDRDVRIGHQFA